MGNAPGSFKKERMNAKKLAERLATCGITVQQICEPCYEEDGLVQISKKIHVQVPLHGNDPGVVRETASGTFVFNDPKTEFNSLLSDIRAAVAEEHSEAASPGLALVH